MMSELQSIQREVKPSDTLLVVDAMTGQEAAGLVKAFNDAAPLTGTHLFLFFDHYVVRRLHSRKYSADS